MHKPTFSITDAATSGLSYVNENRKRVAIWSALMLGPVVILGGISILMIVIMYAAAASAGVTPGSGGADMMSMLLPLIGLPLWTSVGLSILGKSRQGEWHGIRFGKDEALMLGVLCLLVAASAAVGIVGIIIIALAYGLGYLMGGNIVGLIIAVPLGIAAFVAMIWASLRASLIFAASLDQGRLAIVDGWKATKGLVWRLLGTGLLAYLITFVISIAVVIAVMIVGGLIAALGFGAYSVGGWLAASPFIFVGAVLAVVVFTALSVVTYIIGYAPYFDVWRSLTKTAPSQTSKVGDVPVSSIGGFENS